MSQFILRPIELVQRSHGGSGYGISFWSNFRSGCPQRVMLNKLHNTQPDDSEAELTGIADEKINAAHRGTYVHKLLELYYVNRLDPLNPDQVTIEFSGPMETDASWVDALRIFRAYRERFAPNEWQTISAEQRVRFGCPKFLGDPCEAVHDHEEARDFCFANFCVPVISVQFDLVARFDEEQREPLISNRMIPLFDPGTFVVDHKVKNARYRNRESELLHRLQFGLYQKAWNILHPEDQAIGLLANVIYPYKKAVEFESFMVPRHDQLRDQVLLHYLKRCFEAYLAHRWEPNQDACQGFGRTCYWLSSGVCRQVPIDFSEVMEPNQGEKT